MTGTVVIIFLLHDDVYTERIHVFFGLYIYTLTYMNMFVRIIPEWRHKWVTGKMSKGSRH